MYFALIYITVMVNLALETMHLSTPLHSWMEVAKNKERNKQKIGVVAWWLLRMAGRKVLGSNPISRVVFSFSLTGSYSQPASCKPNRESCHNTANKLSAQRRKLLQHSVNPTEKAATAQRASCESNGESCHNTDMNPTEKTATTQM